MKLKLFLFLQFCVFNFCFAERYIQPTKYEDQEEILIQGGSILLSKKTNSVLMYQTSETINDGKANFYFSLLNNTDRPINFLYSNLSVTDQWGRHIKIAHRKDLINDKESEKNWQLFASALAAGIDSFNAQNAGKVNYQSYSSGNYNSNFNSYGSNNWVQGSVSGVSSSTTSGTIHIEALRQQAQRQVQIDSQNRIGTIQHNFEQWRYGLNNFYFDSSTVLPGNHYSANFQILVDDKIEKDLQYVIFTYEFGGENYVFCFYCGNKKKKWYHF